MKPPCIQKLETTALGFPLSVEIHFGDFETYGRHITFADAETNVVSIESPHTIKIQTGLDKHILNHVIPHEVYHLFHSIRHLIKTDEETEAETFSGLVQKIFQINDAVAVIRNVQSSLVDVDDEKKTFTA